MSDYQVGVVGRWPTCIGIGIGIGIGHVDGSDVRNTAWQKLNHSRCGWANQSVNAEQCQWCHPVAILSLAAKYWGSDARIGGHQKQKKWHLHHGHGPWWWSVVVVNCLVIALMSLCPDASPYDSQTNSLVSSTFVCPSHPIEKYRIRLSVGSRQQSATTWLEDR